MCGIVGYIDFSKQSSHDELQSCALKMAAQLRHRGPDDQGVWVDPVAGIALAHRRLSIIDCSEAGHQPMLSVCKRYVLIFNGEIYNFAEMRGQLSKCNIDFRGHSDTEVLLAAFSEWGLKKTLDHLNGMFSIALWDRRERCLHLIRDRLGKKPLYYAWMDRTFLFASELKALRAHPCFHAHVDRDALASYLRMNYVPTPNTIYQNTYKLIPASYFSVPVNSMNKEIKPMLYWDHHAVALKNIEQPFVGSEGEAVRRLHDLLIYSVRMRMISDVPLGAFLSGGIDSSLVVALMQEQSSQPIKTFTIGFHENHFNEANEARAVATHLGTEHTELYITPKKAIAVIPKLPDIYDEPFSDISQIPTYLVSQLARQQVTVALSGDGGDEFFGGYNRHFLVPMLWRRLRRFPYVLKFPLLKAMIAISPLHWDVFFSRIQKYFPSKFRIPNPGDKCHRLAAMLARRSPGSMYVGLVSSWENPESLMIDGEDRMRQVFNEYFSNSPLDFSHQMMYLDATTYLPDDILTKVDRASMAVSLEVRAPLLDYRIAELAWQFNLSSKIQKNKGKQLLRQVLSRYVPSALIDRPKMGFGVPIGEWLRGPLKPWAEGLLSDQRLRHDGFFDVAEVRKKWLQHQNGQYNWQCCLWNLLMFQLWNDSVGF